MASFLSFHEPGFWLVVNLLAMVALLAGWPFVPRRWRGWLLPAYWIALPYLALIAGAVSPRLMGLSLLDWPANLRLGAGLLLALLGLAAIGRLFVLFNPAEPTQRPHRAAPNNEFPAPLRVFASSRAHSAAQVRDGEGPRSEPGRWLRLGATVLLCGAEEFYWCFLRGAFWELLQKLPWPVDLPAYWSLWLAAGLALPLALLPQTNGAARLTKVAILAVTSVAFLYTRNFWLCWLLHAAAWLIFQPQRLEETKDSKETAVVARSL